MIGRRVRALRVAASGIVLLLVAASVSAADLEIRWMRDKSGSYLSGTRIDTVCSGSFPYTSDNWGSIPGPTVNAVLPSFWSPRSPFYQRDGVWVPATATTRWDDRASGAVNLSYSHGTTTIVASITAAGLITTQRTGVLWSEYVDGNGISRRIDADYTETQTYDLVTGEFHHVAREVSRWAPTSAEDCGRYVGEVDFHNTGAYDVETWPLAPSCNATLTFPRQFSAGGSAMETGSIQAASGCAWSVSSSAPWVRVVGGSGTGSGTINASVRPNLTGSSRSATLTTGSSSVVVTQDAGGLVMRDAGPNYVSAASRTATPSWTALQAQRAVIGAATDGLSRIVIAARSAVPLSFSLAGSADSAGTITGFDGAPADRIQPANGVVAALYTPPRSFAPGGTAADPNVVHIGVSDPDVPGSSVSSDVFLRRPPVVLVHGMKSGPSTWVTAPESNFDPRLDPHAADPGTADALKSRGFVVVRADYASFSLQSFNTEQSAQTSLAALDAAIVEAQNQMRNAGIADTQVDVVAHSLGGLVTRLYVQHPSFSYRNALNDYQGSIRRFVSIGTPHQGSRIAELVARFGSGASAAPLSLTARAALTEVLVAAGLSRGVLESLSWQSAELAALDSATPLLTHAIAGDARPGAFGVRTAMNQVLPMLGCPGGLDTVYDDAVQNLHDGVANDLMVDVGSQRGGLAAQYSTVITGITHMQETSDPRVVALLTTLLEGDERPFARSVGGRAARTRPLCGTTQPAVAAPQPPQLQTAAVSVTEGGSVALSATFASGARPTGDVLFVNRSIGVVRATAAGNGRYSASVLPEIHTGAGEIVVLAQDAAGRSLGAQATLTVVPAGTPEALRVDADTLRLSGTTPIAIPLEGAFTQANDAVVWRDLTGVAGASFSVSSGSDVATVSAAGLVSPLRSGNAAIDIQYGGATIVLPVSVRIERTLALRLTGAGRVRAAGLSCDTDCRIQASGIQILEPQPAAGWVFAGWSGDADCLDGRVDLSADVTCTLHFAAAQTTPSRSALSLAGSRSGDVLLYDRSSGAARLQFGDASAFAEVSAQWSASWEIRAGDFDGNGLSDLLFYDPVNGHGYKGLNAGGGAFTYLPFQWTPGWSLTVADFNGDRRDDVLVYNVTTGRWIRCISEAGGGFRYPLSGTWSPNWSILSGDFNGDGRADLFLYGLGADANQGRWFRVITQPDESVTYLEGDLRWRADWQITPGDFDGDRRTDLFLYRASGDWYRVTFEPSGVRYDRGVWSAGWEIDAGDFDGDGRTDLFVYNRTSGRWWVALPDPVSGAFAYVGGPLWAAGWEISAADENGDGRTDLILYNPDDGRYFRALTVAPGTFNFASGNWGVGWSVLATRHGAITR